MTSTSFTVHTTLSPREVLDVITDFGPDRSKWWPNVDEAHFTLHDRGTDWAEVTEGTGMGWERERYSWDASAGTVTIDTLDSNLWGPGSQWRYAITPSGGGSDLKVTLDRKPKSLTGRVVATLIPLVGARTLGKQFESVLRRAESRRRDLGG
ncbi:Polyketide cyclase / dehydrase and lipid transport [Pedococcus dokdonensis]|uniref:Polyketide cyclase / dehydrase and lipid transport n=1 Tax=Pedococcus dokdonensis TaxID=443156 RepID=A0A1H0SS26_9MICO|nr:SRPBCC family protein [Pedococcus dokdonensis]SDP44405.1 Polyketide cyclase / dehydrase and lipid transport [Pedococcus dokdonensis]